MHSSLFVYCYKLEGKLTFDVGVLGEDAQQDCLTDRRQICVVIKDCGLDGLLGTFERHIWPVHCLERGMLPFDYSEFIRRKQGIYIKVEDLSLLIIQIPDMSGRIYFVFLTV
jgi:hypothetical protein